MAADLSEAQVLARALIQAAQSAADAVQQLHAAQAQSAAGRGAGDSQHGAAKFSNASKMVRMPEPFAGGTEQEEFSQWPDFVLNLKAWLNAADSSFEQDLTDVEANMDRAVDLSVEPDDYVKRSQELHSVLVGLLRNRSLKVLRGVESRNGYEVYRQLLKLFTPNTKPRSMALLSAIMSLPPFGKEKSLHDHVQGLDRLIAEYQKTCAQPISEDVKLSVLVRCLPAHIRQHVQLTLTENSRYADVRERVLSFEAVTHSWSTNRIHSEFGINASPFVPGSSAVPMEVDRVEDKGKGKSKSKGKGKGFGDKGKGKGKSKSHQSVGKGKGKQSGSQSADVCLYCGKPGHWKRDCLKFQRDKRQNAVRQVEEQAQVLAQQQMPLQPGTSAQAPAPGQVGQGQQAQVRRVELAPCWDASLYDEDLTGIDARGGSIRMLSCMDAAQAVAKPSSLTRQDLDSCSCVEFDLTYSDWDCEWTLSPELADAVGHVRALPSLANDVDIILDSGADGSALPLSFSGIGIPKQGPEDLKFVDAQGSPLAVSECLTALVDLGGIRLKEDFIIASVTAPLLSLGKLLRNGWSLNTNDTGMSLTKGAKSIPVGFKRNSLCVTGSIRIVAEVSTDANAVRAVTLQESLSRVDVTWTELGPECYGIRSFAPAFVDVMTAPSPNVLWYRTTLVRRGKLWSVVEHNQKVTDLGLTYRGKMKDAAFIDEVLTLGHAVERTHEQLGFSQKRLYEQLLSPVPTGDTSLPKSAKSRDAKSFLNEQERAANSVDGPTQAGIAPSASNEAPRSPGAAIPVAPDEVPEEEQLAGPDEVWIDGVKLTSGSSLKALRAGCSALGLATHGNKAQVFAKILKHLEQQSLLAAHSVKRKLEQETERAPSGPGIPPEPSAEEVRQHNLTHFPYRAWCELCIAHKGRQDQHRPRDHLESSRSLVSFDFGFASRKTEGDDKQAILFAHDRFTKAMHVVPTVQKGGQSLPYLSLELCRFVMWTGHQAVCFRCDNEPSCLALLDAVRKALKGLGVHTTVELVVPADKQANGAAEVTVQVVRSQANLLIQQVEKECGAGERVLFSAAHPVYSWAMLHACWLHNRFVVAHGETAFERCAGRVYTGKVCMFGESVMGFLKPSGKGLPSWQRGVWLGKTTLNDAHIVFSGGGIFITKSVRRLPSPWDLNAVGQVDIAPWECGFGALGPKLQVQKRLLPVRGEAAQAATQQDLEALEVEAYAMTAPFSPADEPTTAQPPPTPFFPAFTPAEPIAAVPATPQAGPLPPETALSPLPTSGSVPAMDLEVTSPKRGHAETIQHAEEPSFKHPRISCLIDGTEYPHEDACESTVFLDEELENLEDFEYEESEQDAGEILSSYDVSGLIEHLKFPHGNKEPELGGDKLAEVDEIAKSVEIIRLKGLGVLLPVESLTDASPKQLSTKFVITWRDKTIDGKRCWLRRARYVAREFAWLSPERQDLFSPASSNITTRLLPTIFLFWKKRFPERNFVLCAMDITDAFLTVDQIQPTIVSSGSETFALGKVLPGQRDGSQMWYDSLTSFVGEELGITGCSAYPSLLKSPCGCCLILLHVDDMMIAATKIYFTESFVPVILKRYKATIHVMEKVGDSIEFLKRSHDLVEDDVIHIRQSSKHFDKLFEVVGIKPGLVAKKVPCHPLMNEADETSELGPEHASKYRTAIGILLYLSSDLIECAYTIRGLAQAMSRPTQRAWEMLRHLASYLTSTQGFALRLKIKEDGLWHSPCVDDAMVLELFSDSDWGAHKRTRKSVSAGAIFFQGCLLSATSRSQRVVSLSSAEAELHAAVSTTCDGILLRLCLEFCIGMKVGLKLMLDNMAAKQVLFRSGVGRIRHLSCRILWIQQHVKEKSLAVASVPTKWNPADLGTKKLSVDRMQLLMNLVGIYDENADSLVGSNVLELEQQKETFKRVMRVFVTKMDTPSVSFAKNVMRVLMMSSIASFTDALSDDTVEESWSWAFVLDYLGMLLICVSCAYSFMQCCLWLRMWLQTPSSRVDGSTQTPLVLMADASTQTMRGMGSLDTSAERPSSSNASQGSLVTFAVTGQGERFHVQTCGHVRNRRVRLLGPCRDCIPRISLG